MKENKPQKEEEANKHTNQIVFLQKKKDQKKGVRSVSRSNSRRSSNSKAKEKIKTKKETKKKTKNETKKSESESEYQSQSQSNYSSKRGNKKIIKKQKAQTKLKLIENEEQEQDQSFQINKKKNTQSQKKKKQTKRQSITEKIKSLQQKLQQFTLITQLKSCLSTRYFHQDSYMIKNYKKQMSKFSQKLTQQQDIENVKQRSKFLANKIKKQLLKIYYDTLDQRVSYLNVQLTYQLLKTYVYQLFQERPNQIFACAFQFRDGQVGDFLREFLLKILFQNCLTEIKQNNPNTDIKLSSLFKYRHYQLTFLTIRESHISYYKQLDHQLKKMVDTIKESWYLTHIFNKFFNGRQRRIIHQSQWIKITEDIIKKNLSQIKVIFIDYSDPNLQGKTYSGDHNKKFPVFINTFRCYNQYQKNFGLLKSYIMFILIHELAHSLIRKIELIKGESESFQDNQFINQNTQSFIRNQGQRQNKVAKLDPVLQDGGWLFQKFAFQNRVSGMTDSDYDSVKGLLQLKQNPDQSRESWDIEGNEKKSKNYVFNQEKYDKVKQTCNYMLSNLSLNGPKPNQNKIQIDSLKSNIDEQIKKLEFQNKEQDIKINFKYHQMLAKVIQQHYKECQIIQQQSIQQIKLDQIQEQIKIFQTFGNRTEKNTKQQAFYKLKIGEGVQNMPDGYYSMGRICGGFQYRKKNMGEKQEGNAEKNMMEQGFPLKVNSDNQKEDNE